MGKAREWWIGGHKVIIDQDLYPFLNKIKWHVFKNKQTYYVATNFWVGNKNHRMTMHRLLTGARKVMVDHINRNGLDNRIENLRFCTAKQNSYNRVRKNRFGYRGVWRPKEGNFAFQIQAGNKRIARYGFKTAKAAALAYDVANKELHGEFGIRNFKD